MDARSDLPPRSNPTRCGYAGLHAGWLLCCSVACAAAGIDLPEVPPLLLGAAPPNVVLSVDTSVSMAAAYLPATLADDVEQAMFTSPDVNAAYYDPARTYLPARAGDGSAYPDASFVAARRFAPAAGDCEPPVDLSTGYRAVLQESAAADCGPPTYVENAPGPAYYHLFDASNGFEPVGGGPCAGPQCMRCGEVFPQPGEGTPDACFDRIVVGSSADVAVAACRPIPRSADNPSGLDPNARLSGTACVSRDNGAAPDAAAAASTNFANWYSYYRSPLLAAQTALSLVMQTASAGIRIAYQTPDDAPGADASAPDDPLAATFGSYGAVKPAFYAWLEGLAFGGNDRLQTSHVRAAGFVAGRIGRQDDAGTASGDADSAQAQSCSAACRSNIHLLVSDGQWDDPWGGDGTTGVWPCLSATACRPDPSQDGRPHRDLPGADSSPGYDPRSAAARPFADENPGMLADLAFLLWRQDLDAASPDRVRPWPEMLDDESSGGGAGRPAFWHPENDPATWQHLALYALTFGHAGAVRPLPDDSFGAYWLDGAERTIAAHGFPKIDASLYEVGAGDVDSADPSADDASAAEISPAAKHDDLLHATLNSRGRYMSAYDTAGIVSDLVQRLDAMANAIDPALDAGPVRLGGALSEDGTTLFQTLLDAGGWSGDLRAYPIAGSGDRGSDCDGRRPGESCGFPDRPLWSAAQRLPRAAQRVILTRAAGIPAPFRPEIYPRLSEDQKRGLLGCGSDMPHAGPASMCAFVDDLAGDDPRVQQAVARIDYLRGDRANERGPDARADGFRAREHPLGPMLGGSPVVVGPPRSRFPDADYAAFRARHSQRTSTLYVGGGDGMLHAIDAETGVERFAYVPEAMYARLADLTRPDYGASVPRRAFVSGGINVADVRRADGGARVGWRTVLVAAMGRGAQGVFALDVTRPDGLRERDAEGVVLWEFTDASGGDGLDGRDMGFSTAPPAIVRVDENLSDSNPPVWVALVANGYNSTHTGLYRDIAGHCTDGDATTRCTVSQSGSAVLYVLRLDGPDERRILAKMDTGAGLDHESGAGRSNGLAHVTAVDVDQDLIADLAYAGDLFGNLWRFDLTDLAAAPKLLFQAQDDNGKPQPITTKIVYQRHPTGIGALLLFGTGQLLNAADKADRSVQSFYGIHDDGAARRQPTREDLLRQSFQQIIDAQADDAGRVLIGRTSSAHGADWSETGHRGWYIDLAVPGQAPEGERIVSAPMILDGQVAFVSVIPADCCGAGAVSWLNVLRADDGSRPREPLLDQRGDSSSGSPPHGGVPLSSLRASVPDEGPPPMPLALLQGARDLQVALSPADGRVLRLMRSRSPEWRNWRQLR